MPLFLFHPTQGQFGSETARTAPYMHVHGSLPGRHEEASMASSSNSMPRDVAAAPRGVHSLVVALRSILAVAPLAGPIGLGSGTEVMSKSCANFQPALGPSAVVEG
ncbi:hypothetical protein BD309DRAFT_950657 [Dichomitus squalens]|nr:hypothetical protein BD309DRAFT_950657 [Dichomitus squalens]